MPSVFDYYLNSVVVGELETFLGMGYLSNINIVIWNAPLGTITLDDIAIWFRSK